jgi:hypothetical protein
MSLSDIATVASIVSSAAVAVLLVYVALQVRQAEKNQRALMQQGRADRAWDGAFRVSDPAISAMWNKGMRTPEALTEGELDQFISICRAAHLSGEDSFLQHRAGLLDSTAYRSFVAGLKAFHASSRGLRAAWRLSSHQYGPEYAAFMDAIMASTPHAAPVDRMALWKETLVENRPTQ